MSTTGKKVFLSFTALLWLVLLGDLISDYRGQMFVGADLPLTTVEFDIVLNKVSSGAEKGSFFWDTGRGFNQGQVTVFSYEQEAGGPAKRYTVALPENRRIKQLRFDPLGGIGSVTIKNFTVHTYNTKQTVFPEYDAGKAHSIGKIVNKNNEVTIYIDAPDPYFVLFDNFSVYQKE